MQKRVVVVTLPNCTNNIDNNKHNTTKTTLQWCWNRQRPAADPSFERLQLYNTYSSLSCWYCYRRDQHRYRRQPIPQTLLICQRLSVNRLLLTLSPLLSSTIPTNASLSTDCYWQDRHCCHRYHRYCRYRCQPIPPTLVCQQTAIDESNIAIIIVIAIDYLEPLVVHWLQLVFHLSTISHNWNTEFFSLCIRTTMDNKLPPVYNESLQYGKLGCLDHFRFFPNNSADAYASYIRKLFQVSTKTT